MYKAETLSDVRIRLAQEAGLAFPEPFFWTTTDLDRLRAGNPDYRSVLVARALDALNSTDGKVRLAAEGDSWFDHPCIREIMDWVEDLDYAVYRSDAPGRLLETMVKEKVYLKFIDDPRVVAMLLSGGGNDLISWKRSSKHTASPIFKPGSGGNGALDYLNLDEVDQALKVITGLLSEFARDIRMKRPSLPIITHCYDWFLPRTSGPFGAWVGPQMDQAGVPSDETLRAEIAALLINRANEAYRLACSKTGMIFVDLRGTTQGRWYDEIHPSREAFGEIAAKLISAIPREGPPHPIPLAQRPSNQGDVMTRRTTMGDDLIPWLRAKGGGAALIFGDDLIPWPRSSPVTTAAIRLALESQGDQPTVGLDIDRACREVVSRETGASDLPATKSTALYFVEAQVHVPSRDGGEFVAVPFAPTFLYVLDVGYPAQVGISVPWTAVGYGDPEFPQFQNAQCLSIANQSRIGLLYPYIAGQLMLGLVANQSDQQVRKALAGYDLVDLEIKGSFATARCRAFHERDTCTKLVSNLPTVVRYAEPNMQVRLQDVEWIVRRLA